MDPHDMPPPDDELGTPERLRALPSRLLGLCAAQAERTVGAALTQADARRWHYAVLAALADSGPASQAQLSRHTGIYRSDLVAVINELADRAIVERAPDAGDRRRNVITLTAHGRRHLERLDALVAAGQDELLAPLSQAERDQLTALLTRLVDFHHARRKEH
jgi:DNA-binding MarR family transcriptional regulator